MPESPRFKLLAAFATVYLVWGSTYLGIRFAIATLPPLLMAGTRFLLAGSILFLFALARGAARPRLRHWRTATILGLLLLLGGNGLVTIAEQYIDSGLAALLIASEPLWLILIAWAAHKGPRPSARDIFGIALGISGVVLLIWPGSLQSAAFSSLGIGLVLVSTVCWAAGSIYGIDAPSPDSPILANGMTMLCGGSIQLLTGLARGEAAQFHPGSVTLTSLLALLYLVVFGSILAFSAYTYLLSATTPARASTYAFVNPVIAVLLGWALAHEPLTARTLLAMVIIVAAVVLLTVARRPAAPEPACTGD